MKIFFPDPIRSLAGCRHGERSYWNGQLKQIIGRFLGPDYRPSCFGDFPFLRCSVYGNSCTDEVRGEAEQELAERYCDWRFLWYGNGISPEYLLPRPAGKGREWYGEAYAILRALDHKGEVGRMLRHPWGLNDTNTYRKMMDEGVLTAFSEWVEMIGL
jgi:hypothetical protein